MQLLLGDCLDQLATLPDACVDAVVTDPPYGFGDGKRGGFMGHKWDYDVPSVEIWQQVFRVLKPGGHLLAFAGTRTQHRMCVNIEDAGFEIRDMIAWVYATGFPKSMDVSKAIDKAAGAEREVVGSKLGLPGYSAKTADEGNCYGKGLSNGEAKCVVTAPATPKAQQWEGWGTALKPALEPITVARKPLGERTVAANVLEHGTGAINIDGCRVGSDTIRVKGWKCGGEQVYNGRQSEGFDGGTHQGRWPANLIHDGSDDVVGLFPDARSSCGGGNRLAGESWFGNGADGGRSQQYYDSGSAARFFYCAKASKADRDDGNTHPTVKPTDLMRYLCRLVTPPGGIVLDPFMGSGSTGKAAVLEGFDFIGVEREPAYLEIAQQRIQAATPDRVQLSLLVA